MVGIEDNQQPQRMDSNLQGVSPDFARTINTSNFGFLGGCPKLQQLPAGNCELEHSRGAGAFIKAWRSSDFHHSFLGVSR